MTGDDWAMTTLMTAVVAAFECAVGSSPGLEYKFVDVLLLFPNDLIFYLVDSFRDLAGRAGLGRAFKWNTSHPVVWVVSFVEQRQCFGGFVEREPPRETSLEVEKFHSGCSSVGVLLRRSALHNNNNNRQWQ